MLVANGALLGMNIKLVGAFLKTMELQTWNQLALFVTILALRTVTQESIQESETHIYRWIRIELTNLQRLL